MPKPKARPRESWLRSDDDNKFAEAMSVCRSAAADCGRKGWCAFGDCFKRTPEEVTQDRAVTTDAELESLTDRVSELEKTVAELKRLTEGNTKQG